MVQVGKATCGIQSDADTILPRERHTLNTTSLQPFVDITTCQHLVHQQPLRSVASETHEDHQVWVPELAQHFDLLLESRLVRNIQDLDGNLGSILQDSSVDPAMSSRA
eukprot:CAMPEP_0204067202 /NCGR_PEP_ID=MMETSP0360-20130528/153157_1 /ASSEMBLY_ACC=CAM_ASM_000342 /TAXON_ID=268821 /ORGANISM="Scrippsiella Hangoei, Strain SHTV-5" /LENGTH=107 /DNA_ID=CAMNT_0051015269 /DNA_START=142 /DNA_END=465 /DNA_ORIENTATION=+